MTTPGTDTAQPVMATREGLVALLQLNRPDRMNAIDDALAASLLTGLAEAAADTTVRAVLLTGAGRSFMAGADLALFAGSMPAAPATAARLVDAFHGCLRAIRTMDKPVIAAVQGSVAGGGLGLALACDLVVAADDAVFVSAYTRIGASPDSGTTWSLTRLLGGKRAMHMMLLNERMDAAAALAAGLVNAVVPRAGLEAAGLALARRVAACAPGASAAVKRLVAKATIGEFEAQLDAERTAFVTQAGTPEFSEGVSAFLARREPSF
jgi:2-(1,2-epoxy-1,2-dihydrophenyl)acetyl-CoA isomerase